MPQGAKAQKATDMPKTCFVAKEKHQEITQKDVRQIISNLGLNIESVRVKKRGQYTWIDVNAERIFDQNRCPVPAYGSAANGH